MAPDDGDHGGRDDLLMFVTGDGAAAERTLAQLRDGALVEVGRAVFYRPAAAT